MDSGKVILYVSVTPDLVARGVRADELIRFLAGRFNGRGGGSATQAQGVIAKNSTCNEPQGVVGSESTTP